MAKALATAATILILVAVGGSLISWTSSGADGLAGSQGVDTSLPATDSAVTLTGRPCVSQPDGCGFQNLKISVNQTRDLLNQAISVTWKGGAPPVKVQTNVAGNFLQIFQCWGDDDGTNPQNPGPPPEQCEFGGFQSNPTALKGLNVSGFVPSRVTSLSGWSTYNQPDGYLDTEQGVRWKPFRAVDGTVVNRTANFNASDPYLSGTGGFWLNPYFNADTTNEDPVAVSQPDGSGSELFTADTGLEAPGLGCGQKIQPTDSGATRIPKCWLVVVPRATSAQENPPERRLPGSAVETSALAPAAWANRIAIPLDFLPVDTPCPIGASERRMSGSELATPAVSSWQPYLCSQAGTPPYNYSSLSDDLARAQLVANQPGAAGLSVVTRAISPQVVDPSNPIVYSPLTVSGLTIGFNIERDPTVGIDGNPIDPAEGPLAGVRVAHINLTPRLVAKLLTESYKYGFGGTSPPYSWIQSNPVDVLVDPDFVQYNPEFANLTGGSEHAGRLVVEQPTSDAAYELWSWILADPEAAAWMSGSPDLWGMQVNPVYNTDHTKNPSGIGFGSPIPNSYPKSDPFCFHSSTILTNANNAQPRPLCILDIQPYLNSMATTALAARTTNDNEKTVLDETALSADTAWVGAAADVPGLRATLSVTDSASAVRYGLQTAALSRAGDDTANRHFVAPDVAGFLAGVTAMVPDSSGLLEPAPSVPASNRSAYPLTMLTYAAVQPRTLDHQARTDYAAFLKYGTGAGQTTGLNFGQLPPGYAPLPSALRALATTAANLVLSGDPAPPASPPTTAKAAVAAAHVSSPARAVTPTATAPAPTPTSTTVVQAPPTTTQPITTPPPSVQVRPAVLRVPTPGVGVSAMKFVMPAALAIGLLALLGVLILDDRWLKSLSKMFLATQDPGPLPDGD